MLKQYEDGKVMGGALASILCADKTAGCASPMRDCVTSLLRTSNFGLLNLELLNLEPLNLKLATTNHLPLLYTLALLLYTRCPYSLPPQDDC